MASVIEDDIDAIMRIMDSAFDPKYGEAWNRKQVTDALAMPNTWHLLADASGKEPTSPEKASGFVLSRGAADEEELLLIAVHPEARGRGVGRMLIERFAQEAASRGVARIFLEMREGNPAGRLYLAQGFVSIGRRRNYYRSGSANAIDALTFSRSIA